MIITDNVKYIGVNDHKVDLFEGQYIVPNGMAYNSYAVIDEKIAIMDTVDSTFADEWLNNIKNALGDRKPDYLVIQHMEPDHSSSICHFVNAYPDAKIVSSAKAFIHTNEDKIITNDSIKHKTFFIFISTFQVYMYTFTISYYF